MEDDPDVRLSKSLSNILRHKAEKFGFRFDEGGFLYVEDLLHHQHFRGYTVEDVERVVKNNDKQRFSLRNHPESKLLQIRANQGHTVKVEGLDLKPITDASEYPNVIHGTYSRYLDRIREVGLSRMSRNHIHFAPGIPGEDGVISGMRWDCDVLIVLDLEKAIKDGIEFMISANNVILSPGDEHGCISSDYFKEIRQTNTSRQKRWLGKNEEKSESDQKPQQIRQKRGLEKTEEKSESEQKPQQIRQKRGLEKTEEKSESEQKPQQQARSDKTGREQDMYLKPITDPSVYCNVIHGVYINKWPGFKQRGISRKKERYINLALGEPGEPDAEEVFEDVRRKFDVMIYIDLEKAMKDGLEFFISPKNTIFCPGNEQGLILPKYFKTAIRISPEIEKLSLEISDKPKCAKKK
ncbi:tRNA 2'-phosphotransferase 1-like [Saccoglossus kowalevskii]|uniref:2'-phosphotransferase n=1 Tax=Saccoglossus kowalevskii TaxID=10224 RepID=A0ABM0M0J4_SACKO|nr:PREDICTED: tRNA 2'-phosphotransferase 1-like [Saccoglossus kowalevskii]